MDKTNEKKRKYEKPEIRKVVLEREQTIILDICTYKWKAGS